MTDTLWVRRSTRVTASSATAGSGPNAGRPLGCLSSARNPTGRASELHDRLPPRHSCDVTRLSFSLWHLWRRSAVGQRPVTTTWDYQRNIFYAKSFDLLFFFFTVFPLGLIIFPTQDIILVEVLSYGAGMARAQRGAVQGNNVFCLLPS